MAHHGSAISLRDADEVRTLPSLEMIPPIYSMPVTISKSKLSLNSYQKGDPSLRQSQSSKNNKLPGLLKTSKPPAIDIKTSSSKSEDKVAFVGFNASNLKLDGAPKSKNFYENQRQESQRSSTNNSEIANNNNEISNNNNNNVADNTQSCQMNDNSTINTTKTGSSTLKKGISSDPIVDELRR
jgi:hypothetical protein